MSRTAKAKDYTITLVVDRSPRQVYAAINDVRGWWTGEISGRTDVLGAEWTYRYEELHRSTQKITELVPDRRVVWHITDSRLSFVKDTAEWNGTDIVFEIAKKGAGTELRFTHVGLAPAVECYRGCSDAWRFYIRDSLRKRILTGKGTAARAD